MHLVTGAESILESSVTPRSYFRPHLAMHSAEPRAAPVPTGGTPDATALMLLARGLPPKAALTM